MTDDGELSQASEKASAVDHELGNAMSTLMHFDHTGDPRYANRDDPVAAYEVVQQTIGKLSRLAQRAEEEYALWSSQARDAITDLDTILAGFSFRQEHGLPGLGRQIREARQRMNTNDVDAAAAMMNLLSQQPDAGEGIVTQLREEYRLVMDLLEEGGQPDMQVLSRNVFSLTKGLDSRSASECMALLHKAVRLDRQLEAVASLVELRDDSMDTPR